MTDEQQQPDEAPSDYIDRLGTNRDTKGMGAINVSRFIIGCGEPISGQDGNGVPAFVPTFHELRQLASYWMQERIEHDFDWFTYQQTGSSEWRWSIFIFRRLDRLAAILGDHMMHQVREDAIASFRKRYPKISDDDWRVFTSGTEEEREAWSARLWEEVTRSQQEGR